jgi:hypothetical protein
MFQRIDHWLDSHSVLFGLQIEHWTAALAIIFVIAGLVAWLERRAVENRAGRSERGGFSGRAADYR